MSVLETMMRAISVLGLRIRGGGHLLYDRFVTATIAVADSAAGVNTTALTLQLYQLDGETKVTSARQVTVVGSSTRFAPFAPSATLSFGTVTKGSIKSSGTAGYYVVETDDTGAFACTATNSADETLRFMVVTPFAVVSGDQAKAAIVCGCNEDAATWS